MEKKQFKMSLGTFIVIIIAIILAVVVVIMGIHIANQNKIIEDSQIAMENRQNVPQLNQSLKNDIATTTKFEDRGIELNVNDSIVKHLMGKIGSEGEKEQVLDEILTVGEFDRNNIPNDLILKLGFLSVNEKDRKFVDEFKDGPLITKIEEMSKETMKTSISNIFGSKINYNDETFKMDLTDFTIWNNPYILNDEGCTVEYKNDKYTTKWMFSYEGGGPLPSVYRNITKALKYNNKIQIYEKIAYIGDDPYASNWTEIIYKNYDYKTNKFSEKISELTNYETVKDFEDKFDTYVYTFELDSTDGEYYLSAFSKVE